MLTNRLLGRTPIGAAFCAGIWFGLAAADARARLQEALRRARELRAQAALDAVVREAEQAAREAAATTSEDR
jgi:hypothetical protein